MADAILDSMLVHKVDYYGLDQTVTDGKITEAYPAAPDLKDLACLVAQDGRTLQYSPVGALIDSDAVMFVALDAAIAEKGKVVWGSRTFIVNGTPTRMPDPFVAGGPIHHLEIGLKEQAWRR